MVKVGTLIDELGRPEDKVQIVRRGKSNTRIARSTDYGRSWASESEQVPSDRVLADDGQRFDQHSANPAHATHVNIFGEPAARLRIQRVYARVTKAKVYIGDNKWTPVQDVATTSILFDGGASAGWMLPTWHKSSPADSEHNQQQDPETREAASAPAPSTADPATPMPSAAHPVGQRFSYIRVSSADQNLARQREMIGPVDKEFLDKLSARSRAERPGLERCLDYLRDHDELIVASIDRLARSLVDLRSIIDKITAKGASVHFVKENLAFSKDSTDPRATLMLGILGSFAEFERAIIRERQAEGIALAKKAGKYKGRKRALTPEKVEQARHRAEAGESKVAIARDLGVSRATVYRALSEQS
ncbi:recombinase family protein [Corynebacterium guangdongense]|uniref:DNA invertase Pin-like site-specific DNA recombinase n=1 Tax=Corynebacterium guangdongense TaxID=1783348 RepID=A0ABU1ZWY0_9CORY|nr:recombinase family protein [Corynebacterium guangdongense]MDR7328737.1 DNA invertase Pin-like site-specific DNA recombinase [Corynebacterium guangdongense]WJZ17314.1 DNA-invertase hin [Corynebacterium guangdongense]